VCTVPPPTACTVLDARTSRTTAGTCAGKDTPLVCTPAFAAPEVVHAYEAGARLVHVAPPIDIWALGIIAYEMLTETQVFPGGTPHSVIFAHLAGREPLPWKRGEAAEGSLGKLRMFRASVLQCLQRDPAQRPTIEELLRGWDTIFDLTFKVHRSGLDAALDSSSC
jgi:serine/threonine protein kinase